MSDTTPDLAPPPELEGVIRLLGNGGVGFTIGGAEVVMAPPKVGALRDLAIAEEDLRQAEMEQALAHERKVAADVAKLTQVREVRRAKKSHIGRPDSVPAAVWNLSATKLDEEQARLNRKITEANRNTMSAKLANRLAWFRTAYDASANGSPPLPSDDDDLDPWMANSYLGRVIIAHWEKMPLSPG